MPVVVLKTHRQEVLALFREHEERRDNHRLQISPIDLLAIFEQIDAFVRNLDARLLGHKDEIDLVGNLDIAGAFRRNIGPRAPNILGARARVGGEAKENTNEQTYYDAHNWVIVPEQWWGLRPDLLNRNAFAA